MAFVTGLKRLFIQLDADPYIVLIKVDCTSSPFSCVSHQQDGGDWHFPDVGPTFNHLSWIFKDYYSLLVRTEN